jgi:hypothetical protein
MTAAVAGSTMLLAFACTCQVKPGGHVHDPATLDVHVMLVQEVMSLTM